MSVDRRTVDYVAALAKLELDDDERAELAGQLARIVEFVEQLDEVDVTDVPPTKHVIGKDNVSRADDVLPGLSQDEALAEAPSADEGHFLVPKVLPD
jgi:aspartyl-tRNA(Asn)/glutamyl-tRNA(Gln) amidotransferase subunit C